MLVTDPLGNELVVTSLPCKIISLVPSQTELLSALGLDKEVAGITSYCVHPPRWKITKQIIGGTKKINVEAIKSISPDLIIANKEENEKEQIEDLSKYFRVYTSDVVTLEDAYRMISDVGNLTGHLNEAFNLCSHIEKEFNQLMETPFVTRRAAYLIWRKPFMAAGHGTFINSMMEVAGFENVFKDKERYPTVTLEELREKNCEVVLLSTEPFHFGEKHKVEISKQLPMIDIHIVDGELFSWYGSRLLKTPAYLRQLRKD